MNKRPLKVRLTDLMTLYFHLSKAINLHETKLLKKEASVIFNGLVTFQKIIKNKVVKNSLHPLLDFDSGQSGLMVAHYEIPNKGAKKSDF